MLRLRIDLAYDGTQFKGWAAQPGLRTVQGEVEAALALVARQNLSVTVAGRTDAGVHARHQVIHVDFPAEVWSQLLRSADDASGLSVDEQRAQSVVRRFNSLLARAYGQWCANRAVVALKGISDIIVYSCQVVGNDFDARFAALSRRYTYRVAPIGSLVPSRRFDVAVVAEALNVQAMQEAAGKLLGEHDFLSFCKPREGATTIRTLMALDIEEHGGEVAFHVQADAFCHSMVRSLVGALLEVGTGKKDIAWPAQLLQNPSRDMAAPLAPPQGLSLENIEYPAPDQWAARVAQSRNRRGDVEEHRVANSGVTGYGATDLGKNADCCD